MALRALSKAKLLITELHCGLHYSSIIAATARREGTGEWRGHKNERNLSCDLPTSQSWQEYYSLLCVRVPLTMCKAFGHWNNYDKTYVTSVAYVAESSAKEQKKTAKPEEERASEQRSETCVSARHVGKRHKHETRRWLGLASAVFDDEIVFNYFLNSISCTTLLPWALSSPWLLSWPALWCHR